jgi:hypothetical protein
VRCERESVPRGRPKWASSEEERILDLLRKAAAEGVSREYLTFTCQSTQCGRAINSLEKRGCVIEHAKFKSEKFVRYILRSEPLEVKPLPDFPRRKSKRDWFVDATGKERPSAETVNLPLFEHAGERR